MFYIFGKNMFKWIKENKIVLSEIVSLGSGFMFDPLYVCDTFYAYNIHSNLLFYKYIKLQKV